MSGMISSFSTGSWSSPLMRERWLPRLLAGLAVSEPFFDAASSGAATLVEASGFPGVSSKSHSSWDGSIFSLFAP
jgi:hypothetical protein